MNFPIAQSYSHSTEIFADDTNVFASGKDLKALELQINLELKKVKEWCDINKLSINLKKTNFMIIKPIRKKNINVNTNITNLQMDHAIPWNGRTIKFLGMMIDGTLSWKYRISYLKNGRSNFYIKALFFS